MNYTETLKLNKPEAADPMRVEDFNHNADLIDAAIAGCARVECGTYKGTGTYGADNPNTLTFGIRPKIVFIFVTGQYGAMANTSSTDSAIGTSNVVFYYGGSKIRTYSSGEGSMYYTLSGNTLTWYSTQSKSVQLNHGSDTYGYIAIG